MRGSGVPDGGVRRSVGSATGPFAGPSLECPGTAAVDEGSNKRVDGPLDGGSDEDLLEVVRAFERFRGGSERSPGVARRQIAVSRVPAGVFGITDHPISPQGATETI